ncbi:hypothetical protein, partial [Vibrio sp. V20_P4S3T152]|uniref:hypothetical protein n=1 Tax=Vibrio sp. V20_P4S3T152 TaxID=1938673 RepID=UPI001C3C2400
MALFNNKEWRKQSKLTLCSPTLTFNHHNATQRHSTHLQYTNKEKPTKNDTKTEIIKIKIK